MAYEQGQVLTHDDGRQVRLEGDAWVPVDKAPAEFSLSEMVSNIPSSAAKFAGDIAQPFMHPVETLKNIEKLKTGLGQKAMRGFSEMGVPLGMGEPSQEEQMVDAIGQFYKGRYGAGEKVKQTAMEDPVGLMSDAAMLLTGGGALAAKAPGLMGRVGKVAQTTGQAMEPINLMGGVAKTGLSMLPKTLPANLYKSAVKFPTTLDVKHGMGTRTKLAETALKHKIMPTEKGILKLAEFEQDLGARIGGLIDDATKSGKSIPKSQVFKHLKAARKEVGGVRVGAQKNVGQVNKLAKELNQQMKGIEGNSLTPNQLQELKRSAQAAAKYEPGVARETGSELGSKAIARAAREGVEQVVPDAAAINKELAELKQLKKPLMQAASRIENRDLISIGTPIKATAGAEMAGGRGAIVGALAGMAEGKKAQMAIGLKQLQDAGLGNLIDQNLINTLIHQGLWQSGREE